MPRKTPSIHDGHFPKNTDIQSLDRAKLVPQNLPTAILREKCLSVKHSIVFPNLEHITVELVENLWSERWPELAPLPYYGMIQLHGGKTELIRTILECIPPEVKSLQGKLLNVPGLDTIRNEQGPFEDWPAHSGYLDYVTDDREPEYWRPYVGQASNPGVRIHQHLTASEKKKRNTLHYYIVAEGGGHRWMNFIRLWSLPSAISMDKSAVDCKLLLNNILETVMGRAFQSLPSADLKRYFGSENYTFHTNGLNVMPCLLQGITLDVSVRSKYVYHCVDSDDDQIQKWPNERRKQRDTSRNHPRKSWQGFQPYWRREDYEKSLHNAIASGEDFEHLADSINLAEEREYPVGCDIQHLIEQASFAMARSIDRITTLVQPYGTTSARVGVVLGPCPVNKTDNDINIQNNVTAIPPALLGAGFSATNSLIWSHNLQQCFHPRPSSNRVTILEEHRKVFSKFHQSLIENSNLRVILLCDRDAENVVLSPHIAANKATLSLRGCTFQIYLELDETKAMIQRVYVRLVASLAVISRCESWEETKEHAEIFRFAASITATSSIRGYSIATKLISQEIILRYWAEKEGLYEPMTIPSMDPKIREWLTLKGIRSDNQIEQFECLGGSLMRGIFLLLLSMPKYPFEREGSKGPVLRQDLQSSEFGRRVFDKETMDRSRKLYTQITGIEYCDGSKQTNALGKVQVHQVEPTSSSLIGELLTQAPADNTHRSRSKAVLEPDAAEPVEEQDDLITSSEFCEVLSSSRRPRENIIDQESDIGLEDNGYQYNPRFSNATLDRDTQERKALLHGKWFEGHLFLHLGNHYQIWALNNMLTVRFSHDDVDVDEGFILQVFLSAPGVRHPHAYAFQAQDDDPAARLAIKVSGTLNNGEEFSQYVFQAEKAWKEPMKINAVFDWFCGASLEDIAISNLPRRYIYVSKKDYFSRNIYGRELWGFVKGGFTDDSLSETERQLWDIERSRSNNKAPRQTRKEFNG